jgi:transposase
VKPPWEGKSKHFTQDFEAFALTLMKEMPMKKVEQITGVADDRLWRMLLSWVDWAYGQLGMEEVTVVGADEMSLRKGHNYLTVFCDLMAKRVLFATPGKDAEVWQAFGQEIQRHNGHPHAIEQVSIDMSPAYIAGVNNTCRHAAVVFDKFHVMSHICKAVDEVRKKEAQSDEGSRRQLKKTLWLWRKNPENLSAKEKVKFKRIDHASLYTAKAYQMRLNLQEIYQLPFSQAKKRFKDWMSWVRREAKKAANQLLDPMVKAAAMIESHLAGILAHWTSGVTNAFLEGLNSVFSATKRKARGYRTNRNFIAMLYFVAAKLKIPTFVPVPFH